MRPPRRTKCRLDVIDETLRDEQHAVFYQQPLYGLGIAVLNVQPQRLNHSPKPLQHGADVERAGASVQVAAKLALMQDEIAEQIVQSVRAWTLLLNERNALAQIFKQRGRAIEPSRDHHVHVERGKQRSRLQEGAFVQTERRVHLLGKVPVDHLARHRA